MQANTLLLSSARGMEVRERNRSGGGWETGSEVEREGSCRGKGKVQGARERGKGG